MAKVKEKNIKVVVAMSGGVDSSVAAAILKQQGYDVVGVLMHLWEASGGQDKRLAKACCSSEAEYRARQVASQLKIPFYVFHFEKDFEKAVVNYFLSELKNGRTPNPCVVCNQQIKFGLLFSKALAMAADFVATGHYVREIKSQKSKVKSENQKSKLLIAKCGEKDQSYFLWRLTQKQLSRVLFPLGNFKSKQEVRQKAKEFGLITAQAPESNDVCFLQDTEINGFLKTHLGLKAGKIVNTAGQAVGKHNGLWFYTIGQRKGLGLSDGPWFVVSKNIKKNLLVVSQNEKDLLGKELFVKDVDRKSVV